MKVKHYKHNGQSIYQIKYVLFCKTTFLGLSRLAYLKYAMFW